MPITYEEFYYRNKDYYDKSYEILMQLSDGLYEFNKSKYYDGLRKFNQKETNNVCKKLDVYINYCLKKKKELFDIGEMYLITNNDKKINALRTQLDEEALEIKGYFLALFRVLKDDDCVNLFVNQNYPELFS